MNKKNIVKLMFILILLFGGCGRTASHTDEVSAEEPIYYSSWLNGRWQSVEVMVYDTGWHRTYLSREKADDLVGKVYSLIGISEKNPTGGAVPICNMEEQVFFYGTGYLSDLELSGNYYTMVDVGYPGIYPCFIIKNKEEWLVWENGHGVYQLKKIKDREVQEQAYDENLSFEENIRIRMEKQGIKTGSYRNNVWGGCWTIEEVVFTECEAEAETHLGESVWYYAHSGYYDGVDYFDINFIESDEDRIFYHMPTTGELGLEGEYYLLIWDEDNEYPAAIVSSEQEMFLIKGNTIFRAVREE